MSLNIVNKEVLSSDGIHTLKGKVYIPDTEIKGLFHLVHGMTEYIGRYDEFLHFMAESGYVAFAYDHLGHGETGNATGELGFIAEKNGDKFLPEDVHVFGAEVRRDFPDKKCVLMGHSMGSFVVRNYAEKYASEIAGLIIMGTGGPNPASKPGIALASVIKAFKGAKYVSTLVDNLAFGKFNDRTKKRTGSDWLSVDKENVDRFLSDDFCNFKFSVSAMIDLIKMNDRCNRRAWAKSLPKELPILLLAGDEDPVGDYGKGVTKVYNMLKNADISDVSMKLYKGYRHEIMNESDIREEVFSDILDFTESKLK